MEKTKSTRPTKKKVSKAQFKKAYMEEVLLNGGNPASVFAFAKGLKSSEEEFYEYYNSFKSLERSIWLDWMEETLDVLEKDQAYTEYSVREKMLAFYFTWLQTLKSNRSFVLKRFEETGKQEINPYFLESLKAAFHEYVKTLVAQGKETSEVADRPFTNSYDKAFWLHFVFITRFWTNDDSSNFEKTDAAIEKSVNLAFDLVGSGPLDSMVDFAKFLFQHR